jgi:hypothetical protein
VADSALAPAGYKESMTFVEEALSRVCTGLPGPRRL